MCAFAVYSNALAHSSCRANDVVHGMFDPDENQSLKDGLRSLDVSSPILYRRAWKSMYLCYYMQYHLFVSMRFLSRCSVVAIAREESIKKDNVTVASGSGIDAEESPAPSATGQDLEAGNNAGETRGRL